MIDLTKSNKTYLLIDQMLNSGINFIIMIMLAKILGAKSFGDFSLIFFIAQLFIMIETGFISTMMMIDINKYRKNRGIYNTYILLKLFFLISLIVIILPILTLLHIIPLNLLFITILFFLFYLIYDLKRKYLISIFQYKNLLFQSLVYMVVLSASFIYVKYNNLVSIESIFIIMTISLFVSTILINRLDDLSVSISKVTFLLRKDKNSIVNLIKSSLLQWTTQRFIFYFQNFQFGSVDIGKYNAYASIIGILNPFYILLDSYILPRLANKSIEELENYINKVVYMSLILVLFVIFIFILNLNSIILFLLSEEYLDKSYIFYYLSGIYIMVLLNKKYYWLINALKIQQILTKVSLNTLIFTVPLLYLIYTNGINGLALLILLSQCFMFINYHYEYKKYKLGN